MTSRAECWQAKPASTHANLLVPPPQHREAEEADGVIRVGGSEYLRVTATAPGTLTLRVEADPERVDPFVRIFYVR